MSYEKLVRARKHCRKCHPELRNPAEFDHDADEVGPWSRWLASRPAELILVGQDWGDVGYFQKYKGRDIPDNRTNKRLIKYLKLLGFEVGPPNITDHTSGVFATNAILCLKQKNSLVHRQSPQVVACELSTTDRRLCRSRDRCQTTCAHPHRMHKETIP
jgi:hypothetical protein